MLLRNQGGESFVDVTVSSGTGEMHKGHGVAFADLDNDGDEEIVFKVGGATPGDAHAFRLFENPGHGNDWLGLNLVGVQVEPRGHRRPHQGHRRRRRAATRRADPPDGHAAAVRSAPHRFEQHIGLGKASRIVELEVRWPASGTRQAFADVAEEPGDRDS